MARGGCLHEGKMMRGGCIHEGKMTLGVCWMKHGRCAGAAALVLQDDDGLPGLPRPLGMAGRGS